MVTQWFVYQWHHYACLHGNVKRHDAIFITWEEGPKVKYNESDTICMCRVSANVDQILDMWHTYIFCCSLQSLLNQHSPPVYYASLIPPYVVMVIMGVWAYVIAGGSGSNLKAFITGKQAGYSLWQTVPRDEFPAAVPYRDDIPLESCEQERQ